MGYKKPFGWVAHSKCFCFSAIWQSDAKAARNGYQHLVCIFKSMAPSVFLYIIQVEYPFYFKRDILVLFNSDKSSSVVFVAWNINYLYSLKTHQIFGFEQLSTFSTITKILFIRNILSVKLLLIHLPIFDTINFRWFIIVIFAFLSLLGLWMAIVVNNLL